MERTRDRIEEQLLVMDAQDGSAEALSRLVDRWQKRLWAHAWRLTGDRDAAWDVTQQTWLGVVRGLRRLEDPARFGPWAYRIATNKAADWVRRRKRRTAPLEEPDRHPAPPAAEAGDEASGLRELLSMMDRAKQTVLWLYYFDRFSVREIGTALGVPAGTVKSRLHAARNELKTLWERHHGEGLKGGAS